MGNFPVWQLSPGMLQSFQGVDLLKQDIGLLAPVVFHRKKLGVPSLIRLRVCPKNGSSFT